MCVISHCFTLAKTAPRCNVNIWPLNRFAKRRDVKQLRPGLASIVSTDFFYGFPRLFDGWPDGQRFAADFAARAVGADLIDMEVAQFYWLAPLFNPSVEYLAIKGPSNAIGAADEQVAKSPAVTEQCAAAAFKLLGLPS